MSDEKRDERDEDWRLRLNSRYGKEPTQARVLRAQSVIALFQAKAAKLAGDAYIAGANGLAGRQSQEQVNQDIKRQSEAILNALVEAWSDGCTTATEHAVAVIDRMGESPLPALSSHIDSKDMATPHAHDAIDALNRLYGEDERLPAEEERDYEIICAALKIR